MKKSLSYFSITLILSLLCSILQAQVSHYTYDFQTAAYTPLGSGQSLGTTFNDDQIFNDVDAGSSNGPGYPIGFPFTFKGQTFDHFSVSVNGYIVLGTSIFTTYQTYSVLAEPGTTGFAYAIAGLSTDLEAQGNSLLQYSTIGTAPNRTLVVEWNHYRKYGAGADDLNFQIRLHETTNAIELSYGTMISDAFGATAQVGLRGATATNIKGLTTTTNWAAATYTTSSSAALPLHTAAMPASGFGFVWTPGSTLPVNWLWFTAQRKEGNVALQWRTANEQHNQHFILERSKDGQSFTAFQTVKAAGNGITSYTYTAIDQQPYAGTSFYRIQQVDKDGSIHYSPTAHVKEGTMEKEAFTISSVSSDGYFIVRSETNRPIETITISITNPAGTYLHQQQWKVAIGTQFMPVDLRGKPGGLYLVQLYDQQGQLLKALKVMKQ